MMATPIRAIQPPFSSAGSTVSMVRPVSRRPSPRNPTRVITDSSSTDASRRTSMASFRSTIAQRRLDAALRTVAIGGLAAMLGGCYSVKQDFATYPQDYRERHPITLRDGCRTVEVFLGRSRGGLSPAQRADVLAFAQTWKHEATSGIVVDVPNAPGTKLAAADSMREIHSILSASGVPGN